MEEIVTSESSAEDRTNALDATNLIRTSELPFLVTHWLANYQPIPLDESRDRQRDDALQRIQNAASEIASAFAVLGAYGMSHLVSGNCISPLPAYLYAYLPACLPTCLLTLVLSYYCSQTFSNDSILTIQNTQPMQTWLDNIQRWLRLTSSPWCNHQHQLRLQLTTQLE